MSIAHSIVIVRAEHHLSVKKRLAEAESVDVVAESELLQLQDTLVARPPDVLVMHSAFANTSRGAMLVAALKGSQGDNGTAIRVFIEDEVRAPLMLADPTMSPHDALLETTRSLDRAGTRQAERFKMNRYAVAVNGESGQLIDISISGAQVQAATRLRPTRLARLVLPDATGDLRLEGTVAWAIAVPAEGAIHYRAGVEFVAPDKRQLTAFCKRRSAVPDPTLSQTW
jgi:hypothetical protein